MKWKIYFAATINFICIIFPYNIIGCGPDADPYDYYTSFFHNDISGAKGFQPFYFTGLRFLYDEQEPVKTESLLSAEWAGHCGVPVTDKDAYNFVMSYAWKDLNNIYLHLEKKQVLKIPDSVSRNSMTKYFMNSNDLEGLGYIMFSKKAEVYTGGQYGDWEKMKRDSVKMTGLVKNALQLYGAAKQDFYKLRYAYQAIRLSHYCGRYTDVIAYYDKYILPSSEKTILQQLSLGLKAGALFNQKKRKESAYLFSRAFAMGPAKRISNYLGFTWSIDHAQSRLPYLALCKNDAEKAWMVALFAMENSKNEYQSLEKIYSLDPSNEVLEILAIREINKIEENYLSPELRKQKGGKAFFYYWSTGLPDTTATSASNEAKKTQTFLHKVAQDKNVPNPALFEIGAAYIAFMLNDLVKAKQYLANAQTMKQSDKIMDQWSLTNLLVTINEKDKIDPGFEEQVLPSIKWLEAKATKDESWKKIYRNLMSEILAQRYYQQGDKHKEMLAVGAADWINNVGLVNDEWSYKSAIDYMRNSLGSGDAERLYSLLQSKGGSGLEKYLITHNSIKSEIVTDFAGTAYLREYKFDKAIDWFKRPGDKKSFNINKNPFIDLLYDQEEALLSEKSFVTTKTAFAEEMKKLLALAETDKVNSGKHYYKYALGLYNTTYYGHTWEMVEYYRSGSDGYHIPKDADAFRKEYYGCFAAERFFEKAMKASTDKNLQAKALFMMAKCAQKQVHTPQYDEYPNNYEAYEAASKKYFQTFKRNKYFPALIKEYGTTPFYKTAFSTCSYLRDFVRKK